VGQRVNDNIIEDNFSKFYFRSVYIKLVALCMNLYQEVALVPKRLVTPVVHTNTQKKHVDLKGMVDMKDLIVWSDAQ